MAYDWSKKRWSCKNDWVIIFLLIFRKNKEKVIKHSNLVLKKPDKQFNGEGYEFEAEFYDGKFYNLIF